MTANRPTVRVAIQYLRDMGQHRYADAVIDLLGEIDDLQNPPHDLRDLLTRAYCHLPIEMYRSHLAVQIRAALGRPFPSDPVPPSAPHPQPETSSPPVRAGGGADDESSESAAHSDSTPCEKCGGVGLVAYGSTAAWRGRVGGQTMTNDVCDQCWGSGDADRPWPSHRSQEHP